MSFADYNEFIQRELQPEIVETVIRKKLAPWIKYFGEAKDKVLEGDRITSKYRLGYTSNAAFYDKSDVNPAPSTQTLGKPYWDKVFSHGACEVHGIDISNSAPGDKNLNLLGDAVKQESEALANVVVGSLFTQIKKDVDSTSVAYSDKELSRSTYPTLASYEEATNATITLAYMRGMINGVTVDNQVDISDYVGILQSTVYNTLKPLAAVLHTWNINDPASREAVGMGWRPMNNFEGLDIADQNDFPSMTTGDCFMLRRKDVNIVPHRLLSVELVPSGRDSIEAVLRSGTNIYVDNPGLQGKMTDKD